MRGPKAGRPIPQLTEADLRRFWNKVSLPDENGCMMWAASKDGGGYGQFWLKGTYYRAHRVSYTFAYGEIPPGKVLDHLCRNRVCVAPGHLEVVDNRTNILRGEGPSAENAMRTRCPRGHEYTAENTYHAPPNKSNPNGYRHCRTCDRERKRAPGLSRTAVSAPPTQVEQVDLTLRRGQ